VLLDRLVDRVEERRRFRGRFESDDNRAVGNSGKELLDLGRGVGGGENDVETLTAENRGELVERVHRDGVMSLPL